MKVINEKTLCIIGISLAFILWYFVFITSYFDSFWLRIILASTILALFVLVVNKKVYLNDLKLNLTELMLGVFSGFTLYFLFYLGFSIFKLSVEEGAGSVYLFKSSMQPIFISIALILTSFCEEYFWRFYIQKTLVQYFNMFGVILCSITYALVHIPTLNLPLVIAAFIAGLYWGLLYEYSGSFGIIVVSHIVWTQLIFVLLPLL